MGDDDAPRMGRRWDDDPSIVTMRFSKEQYDLLVKLPGQIEQLQRAIDAINDKMRVVVLSNSEEERSEMRGDLKWVHWYRTNIHILAGFLGLFVGAIASTVAAIAVKLILGVR